MIVDHFNRNQSYHISLWQFPQISNFNNSLLYFIERQSNEDFVHQQIASMFWKTKKEKPIMFVFLEKKYLFAFIS